MQTTPLLPLPIHTATSCTKHQFPVLSRKPSHPGKPTFGLSPPGSRQWLFPQRSHTLLHKTGDWPLPGSSLHLAPGHPLAGTQHLLRVNERCWNRSFQGRISYSEEAPQEEVPVVLPDSGHTVGSFLDPRARAGLSGPVSTGCPPSTESLFMTAPFS